MAAGWSSCSRGSSGRRNARGEAERLLEYGYREFKNYKLFSAGDTVEQANVWLGNHNTVPLVLQQDVVVSLTTEGRRALEAKVAYDGPIPAPVVEGDQLAELEITAPGYRAAAAAADRRRDGARGQPVRPGDQRAWLSHLGAVVIVQARPIRRPIAGA